MKLAIQFSMAMCMLVAGLSGAEGPPKFKTEILTDAVRFVQGFSEDKQACTMIFDNFIIATEIGKGSSPSVVDKSFTYVTQPESDKEVQVVQHVRGFVSTQGNASASLVIHAGGKTTVVDLSKAIKAAKTPDKPAHESLREKVKKSATDAGFTVDGRPEKSDNFFVEIKSRVPAGKPLQTTCQLLVDRLPGEDGSGSVLQIDTIDFEVFPAPPGKK